jgi:RNA polymerase sigma-B factor
MSSSRRRTRSRTMLAAARRLPAGPARDRLLSEVVLVNRAVAEAVAARFGGRGVPREDLRQTAYEGLTKAVRRFDPGRGEDLLTFAVPTIRGEVLRWFRDQAWTVRPPRGLQELHTRVVESRERLTAALGREPRREEVAADLSVPLEEYDEAVGLPGRGRPASLDQPLPRGPGTVGDVVPDRSPPPPVEERADLAPLLRRMPPADRELLRLRFAEDLTQAEIGRRLGLGQRQVSRRLERVLGVLRRGLLDPGRS